MTSLRNALLPLAAILLFFAIRSANYYSELSALIDKERTLSTEGDTAPASTTALAESRSSNARKYEQDFRNAAENADRSYNELCSGARECIQTCAVPELNRTTQAVVDSTLSLFRVTKQSMQSQRDLWRSFLKMPERADSPEAIDHSSLDREEEKALNRSFRPILRLNPLVKPTEDLLESSRILRHARESQQKAASTSQHLQPTGFSHITEQYMDSVIGLMDARIKTLTQLSSLCRSLRR